MVKTPVGFELGDFFVMNTLNQMRKLLGNKFGNENINKIILHFIVYCNMSQYGVVPYIYHLTLHRRLGYHIKTNVYHDVKAMSFTLRFLIFFDTRNSSSFLFLASLLAKFFFIFFLAAY